ncbi:peptidyl-prolyl cis-trans isomerase [Priestia koreensis]|uniref:peptidyl-prolyl cis-trans isomerase n=1 Tax=Priestia koreensis TaxID=284581 RepID=UPI000AB6BE6A|nr:peptidyl-prolyl cis-trans isomerase [Priestia koreensis]
MNTIMSIEGNVQYAITLDAGVWIFDDRKVDLTTYFQEKPVQKDEIAEYTKSVSAHWDREIQEGAVFPPTLKTERKFKKQEVLTGTFGISFRDFLKNAEPLKEASVVTIVTENDQITIPLEQAYTLILGFSKDGKPLLEDGPIHVYYEDGSNEQNPIKHVRKFVVQ